jgi:hypothetical protein
MDHRLDASIDRFNATARTDWDFEPIRMRAQ